MVTDGCLIVDCIKKKQIGRDVDEWMDDCLIKYKSQWALGWVDGWWWND